MALVTRMICNDLKENRDIYIENGEIRSRIKKDRTSEHSKIPDSKDLLKVIASQFDKLLTHMKVLLKVCAVAGIFII